jgi:hypothetical protein
VSGGYNSDYLGGLVGYKDGGSIGSSYFLITSGPDNGYGVPLTDEQMKQQESFVGWDFSDEIINGSNGYWRMCEDGVSYPRLSWEYSSYGDLVCPDGVNLADYAVLAGHWLETDCGESNNWCEGSDFDRSGDVGTADLATLAGYWLEGI